MARKRRWQAPETVIVDLLGLEPKRDDDQERAKRELALEQHLEQRLMQYGILRDQLEEMTDRIADSPARRIEEYRRVLNQLRHYARAARQQPTSATRMPTKATGSATRPKRTRSAKHGAQ